MKGYTGKVCIINCSTHQVEEKVIPDFVYEHVLSGVGLGVYMCTKYIPPMADPLGPDNMLGFVSGLLTGTGSVVTGRWMAVCKSPLTQGWGDANCGGNLSIAIKQCGYDGIFFTGVSLTPQVFVCDALGPRLVDATEWWGKDAVETEEMLQEAFFDKRKPAVAVIGQAAENLSLISGISNDKGRMAARSGVGAVMGSKKLKAIVLLGNQSIQGENPELIREISKEYILKIKQTNLPKFVKGAMLPTVGRVMAKMKKNAPIDGLMSAYIMKKWGTIAANTLSIPTGDNPIKNWDGSFLDISRKYLRNMNPDRIISREIKKYHCYSCVIGCGGICNIQDLNKGKHTHTHKPEYETVNAFGALLLNDNLESIYILNEMLNRATMDSISAGNTVAFAMECYEKGILTKEMTDGLELTWGNSEAIIQLVDKMIRREGIGDWLADGVLRASEKIKNSFPYAVLAGGQEPGMHDPRFDPILGVHFSADPTPGRHTVGAGAYYNYMRLWEQVSWAPKVANRSLKADDYLDSVENALKSKANSCIKQVLDGSGGCLFAMIMGMNHWRLFDWLNAATGWNKSADEYMEIGLRIQTMRQLFNIREGIEPLSMMMSKRIAGQPPQTEGPNKNKTVPIDQMVERHYLAMGWDAFGVPLASTITHLNIQELYQHDEN